MENAYEKLLEEYRKLMQEHVELLQKYSDELKASITNAKLIIAMRALIPEEEYRALCEACSMPD